MVTTSLPPRSRRGIRRPSACEADRHRVGERLAADVDVLELEPEHLRRPPARVDDRRVVGLREQHDAPVVAEVHVAQLGMTVEPERSPHQRVEVLGEEVGEVEGAGLGLVQRREQLASRP